MQRTILLAAFAAVRLWGQGAAAFEVATIKPAVPSTDGRTHIRMSSDTEKGSLAYGNVGLKDVIAKAYNVQQYQVSGPDWMETERYDIVAKFAPHTAPDRVPPMLQALLAERFKVALHRETRELPMYSLVVAKGGPKFKSDETNSGVTSDHYRTRAHVAVKGSMERFAEFLTGEVGRPVFDKTGLSGSYELTLDWAPDGSPADPAAPLPSLFTALQEQLGLRLESAKGPVETLVVDRADRTPTEN
jgi:uncharacterized protein (TIGR03435 family)